MNKERPPRRTPTPQTLQMEAAECGAACLSMVLAYHRCHVSLAELRAACEVSREGSKASDLLRAARFFGMIARGYRSTVAGLAEVSLPAILFWNENHFVVLEGWSADRETFWINDPAFGHRTIPAREFSRSFSGVVLIFSPGPEFQMRKAPPGILRWSLRKMADEPIAAAFVSLAAILLMAPSLAVPVFMRVFVDEYYINEEYFWLWPLLAGMSVAAFAQLGLIVAIRRVLLRWELRQAERDSQELLQRLQRLPMLDRLARGSVELAARLALPAENARLIFHQFGGWLIYLPTALASVIWMSVCGWKLAVLLIFLLLGTAGTLWIISRTQRERQAEVAVRRAQFENGVIRGLTLIDSLNPGGRADFLSQLMNDRERIFTGELRLALSQLSGRVLGRLLAAIAFVGILAVGTGEVMESRLTPGALIAFLVLWLPLSGWLIQMLPVNRGFRELAINRERLADLPPAEVLPPAKDLPNFEELEMRDVTFGYSRSTPPILKNVSFRITSGRRIALIGESGSGKSTLVRLLAGLLKPNEGTILLNGSATTPERFKALGAWADSDSVLLAGSAEALCDSQRQRLEMTRWFARSPQLLILDEATNAMDAESEWAIAAEWRQRNGAWLWLTQSPVIARASDEIWVLANGEIAERGTWEELTKRSERFRQLMAP